MLSRTRTAAICAATAIAAVTATAALPAIAAKKPPAPTVAAPALTPLSIVYQGKIVNQHIILGPQSNATLLVRTPALPAGTYLVTAIVGAIIASHDQIVCAALNVPNHNQGVFGTAGNPGTGGIYGTATITDTIHASAGQHISVTCNSFSFGKGTYAGEAVVEAVPVSHVN
jgi:hypothetical protein